jgi:hypothetical protein
MVDSVLLRRRTTVSKPTDSLASYWPTGVFWPAIFVSAALLLVALLAADYLSPLESEVGTFDFSQYSRGLSHSLGLATDHDWTGGGMSGEQFADLASGHR